MPVYEIGECWYCDTLQAAQASQAGLVETLQGMWCDAVVALVGWEWGQACQAMLHPSPASTTAAVQAWLQVLE